MRIEWSAAGVNCCLKGGYSLADFTAERDGLQLAIDAIEGLENARVLAAGDRDLQKENLLERMR